MPQPGIQHALGIRHLHIAGTDDADGFQILRPKHRAKAALARADSAAGNQGREPRLGLAGLTYADNLRAPRGVGAADMLPFFAEPGSAGHHGDNPLLYLPGIHAPKLFGIFNNDFVVDDVDPHRLVGAPFHHHPIPASRLQHGAEAAAEVATVEFAGGKRLRRDAAYVCAPAPRHAVPARGPVMSGSTFRGSYGSRRFDWPGATDSSQKMAAPMP